MTALRAENYPPDWPEIAAEIKEACDYQCQLCDRRCTRPDEAYAGQENVLTVAHWDREYEAEEVFVVALCSRCHLQHDAAHTWPLRRLMWHRRQRRAGQLTLLDGDGQ